MVRGVTSDLQTRRIQQIHKRLANVQRHDRLSERESMPPLHIFSDIRMLNACLVIPCILEDSRRLMESWGSAGKFDPFEKVYEVRRHIHITAVLWGSNSRRIRVAHLSIDYSIAILHRDRGRPSCGRPAQEAL